MGLESKGTSVTKVTSSKKMSLPKTYMSEASFSTMVVIESRAEEQYKTKKNSQGTPCLHQNFEFKQWLKKMLYIDNKIHRISALSVFASTAGIDVPEKMRKKVQPML